MINKNDINDAYPLHRIDDQIDSMCGSAWLTTLNLTKGYHQMNLDVSSCKYGIYNAYGTVSMVSLAYGYEDFWCRLSTLDGFSSGGSSAKDCRSIH